MAAATAFATGTSWGTMAILMPLAVPLTVAVQESAGASGDALLPALYVSVSTVLAGAVWGDHVSPSSDTTVLSSLASGPSRSAVPSSVRLLGTRAEDGTAGPDGASTVRSAAGGRS